MTDMGLGSCHHCWTDKGGGEGERRRNGSGRIREEKRGEDEKEVWWEKWVEGVT